MWGKGLRGRCGSAGRRPEFSKYQGGRPPPGGLAKAPTAPQIMTALSGPRATWPNLPPTSKHLAVAGGPPRESLDGEQRRRLRLRFLGSGRRSSGPRPPSWRRASAARPSVVVCSARIARRLRRRLSMSSTPPMVSAGRRRPTRAARRGNGRRNSVGLFLGARPSGRESPRSRSAAVRTPAVIRRAAMSRAAAARRLPREPQAAEAPART